jgi:hypothetical protein
MLLAAASSGIEVESPKIGGAVLVDLLSFSADSAWGQFGDAGRVVGSPSRFRLRKATLEVAGSVGDAIGYETILGIASCTGGNALTVHEAVVSLRPWGEGLTLELGQGHVHKGFELGEECGETLTAEKPRWSKLVSPVCHPLGAIAEAEIDIGAGRVEVQGLYANGVGGTLEDEYNANVWCRWDTPLEGVSVGGFVNDMKMELNPTMEGMESASRWGVGLDVGRGSLLARAEYLDVKGLTSAFRLPYCEEDPESVENSALLAQGGWRFETGSSTVSGLVPYLSWQSWNRWSNVDTGDYTFQWLTAGLRARLPQECYAMVEYMTPLATPEDLPEDAGLLTMRLGAGF